MENEKLKQYDEEEKRLDQQIEVVKQKQEALRQKKEGDKLYRASNIFLLFFGLSLIFAVLIPGPSNVIKGIYYLAIISSTAALACIIPDAILVNRKYKKEQALKRELEKLREESNQLAWKRNNQLTRINQAKKEMTPQKAYIPEEPTIIEMTQPKVKSKSYKRN